MDIAGRTMSSPVKNIPQHMKARINSLPAKPMGIETNASLVEASTSHKYRKPCQSLHKPQALSKPPQAGSATSLVEVPHARGGLECR
jgi:hypothetical protein